VLEEILQLYQSDADGLIISEYGV